MSPFFCNDHWSSLCLSSTITPWGSLLARNPAACGWAGSPLTTISTTWTSTSPRSGQWQWPWEMNKATSIAGARERWRQWEVGNQHWASGSEAFLLSSYLFSSNGFCSAFFSSSSPFSISSFLFTPFSSCPLLSTSPPFSVLSFLLPFLLLLPGHPTSF